MKKKLVKQMLNEWRGNIWIVLEFVIVSVVLWFIADFFYASVSISRMPRGFNADHCYLLTLYEITDKSPEYIPGRTTEDIVADRLEILDRLKRRPEVEAASFSNNSYPYNGNNSNISFTYDSISEEGIRRIVTPDFVKVFRYRGANGETTEQLAEALKDGKILISDDFFNWGERDDSKSVTRLDKSKIRLRGDTASSFEFVPIQPVMYGDYQPWSQCAVFSTELVGGDKAVSWMGELCIRVKPEMDKDIVETLMSEAQKQFHVGNYILNNVQSFDDIRESFQNDESTKQRNYIVGMVFLLINVFLGLLGTFWFRTRQRIKEIALRKVSGATSLSVFTRLVSEGLTLLAVATPIAYLFDILIAKYELNRWFFGYFAWGRCTICALIAFALMAIMVIAGIYIPARRAMKVMPAESLKNE